MKQVVMACLALVLATQVYAEQKPRALPQDGRMKAVIFQEDNVYSVFCNYGYSTHIVFDREEVIDKVDMGDAATWAVNDSGNHLFVKPKLASTTNMTVITNKHSYAFKLTSTNDKKLQTYQLKFIYPELDKARAFKKRKLERTLMPSHKSIDPKKVNWRYSFAPSGARELAPIAAFDNGEFTYFKFDKTKKMPAIFAVDTERNESLVNYDVEGDYVVIHQIGKLFTLRVGDSAVAVFNENYAG